MKLLIDDVFIKNKIKVYCTKIYKNKLGQNPSGTYYFWIGLPINNNTVNRVWENIKSEHNHTRKIEIAIRERKTLEEFYDISSFISVREELNELSSSSRNNWEIQMIEHLILSDDTVDYLKKKICFFLPEYHNISNKSNRFHLWCDTQIEFTRFYAEQLTQYIYKESHYQPNIKDILRVNFGEDYPLKSEIEEKLYVSITDWNEYIEELIDTTMRQTVFLGKGVAPFFWLKYSKANPFEKINTVFGQTESYNPFFMLSNYENMIGNVISVCEMSSFPGNSLDEWYFPQNQMVIEENLKNEIVQKMFELERSILTYYTKPLQFNNFHFYDCVINVNFQETKNRKEVNLLKVFSKIETSSNIPFMRFRHKTKSGKSEILYKLYNNYHYADEKGVQIVSMHDMKLWLHKKDDASRKRQKNIHGLTLKQFLYGTNDTRYYTTIHIYDDGKIAIRVPLKDDLQEHFTEYIYLALQNCKQIIQQVSQSVQLPFEQQIIYPESELVGSHLYVSNNVKFGNVNMSIDIDVNQDRRLMFCRLQNEIPFLFWSPTESNTHFYYTKTNDYQNPQNILRWIYEMKRKIETKFPNEAKQNRNFIRTKLTELLRLHFDLQDQQVNEVIEKTIEMSKDPKFKMQKINFGIWLEMLYTQGGKNKLILRGSDGFQTIGTLFQRLQYIFDKELTSSKCGEKEIKKIIQPTVVTEAQKQQQRSASISSTSSKPPSDVFEDMGDILPDEDFDIMPDEDMGDILPDEDMGDILPDEEEFIVHDNEEELQRMSDHVNIEDGGERETKNGLYSPVHSVSSSSEQIPPPQTALEKSVSMERQQSVKLTKYPIPYVAYRFNKQTVLELLQEADNDIIEKYRDALSIGRKKRTGTTSYAVSCQSGSQPIPVDKEHLDKIMEYSPAAIPTQNGWLRYGKNGYYYICPEAWCFKCNFAFTKKDIKFDYKCPKCSFVYNNYKCPQCKGLARELNCPNCKYIGDPSSLNIYLSEEGKNFPGYVKPYTDEKGMVRCALCCYKNVSKSQVERIKQCQAPENSKQTAEDIQNKLKQDIQKNRSYVSNISVLVPLSYGVFHNNLWKFLDNPPSTDIFEKNAKIISKDAKDCFLRKGINKSEKHSFLELFVALYNQNVEHGIMRDLPEKRQIKSVLLTDWKELVNTVIVPNLTPYLICKAKKGFLISIFSKNNKPNNQQTERQFNQWLNKYSSFVEIWNSKQEIEKYVRNGKWTENIGKLFKIYDCHTNLVGYLKDEHVNHHYRFLWELLILPGVVLPNGINLFLFEHITKKSEEDGKISENVNYICPLHPELDSFYNEKNPFFTIAMKNGNYFELITRITSNKKKITDVSIFNKNKYNSIYEKIMTKLVYGCKSYPQTIYWKSEDKYIETRISLEELTEICEGTNKYRDYQIEIVGQVIDYFIQVESVLLQVRTDREDEYILFPIKKSSLIVNKPIVNEDINTFRYVSPETLDLVLKRFNAIKYGLLSLKLKSKIEDVEGENVVAVVLENNNIIPVLKTPTHLLDVPIHNEKYYQELDEYLQKDVPEVDERIDFMRQNKYFWKTYKQICYQVSDYLNKPVNRKLKQEMKRILENSAIQKKQKTLTVNNILREIITPWTKVEEVDMYNYVTNKKYISCSEVKENNLDNCSVETVCMADRLVNKCFIPVKDGGEVIVWTNLLTNELVNNYLFKYQIVDRKFQASDTEDENSSNETILFDANIEKVVNELDATQKYVKDKYAFIEQPQVHDNEHYYETEIKQTITVPIAWKKILSDYFFIIKQNYLLTNVEKSYEIFEKIFYEVFPDKKKANNPNFRISKRKDIIEDYVSFLNSIETEYRSLIDGMGSLEKIKYLLGRTSYLNQTLWEWVRESKERKINHLTKEQNIFTIEDWLWVSFYMGINIIVLSTNGTQILANLNQKYQQYPPREQQTDLNTIILFCNEKKNVYYLSSMITGNNKSSILLSNSELPTELKIMIPKFNRFVSISKRASAAVINERGDVTKRITKKNVKQINPQPLVEGEQPLSETEQPQNVEAVKKTKKVVKKVSAATKQPLIEGEQQPQNVEAVKKTKKVVKKVSAATKQPLIEGEQQPQNVEAVKKTKKIVKKIPDATKQPLVEEGEQQLQNAEAVKKTKKVIKKKVHVVTEQEQNN